jgi:hypothetical protein
MSYTQPHCAIYGYNFSDIVRADSVSPSGGSLQIEELSNPDRKYADVRAKGRQPKRYSISARSIDRDEIETFLSEAESAPIDSEFYPFDAERHGLKAAAHCSLKQIADAYGKVLYEGEAVITCRDPWLYGPEQGIAMVWNGPANVTSELLTNAGQERAYLSYLQASGDLSLPYVEDLSCRITLGSDTTTHDRQIQLCEKMLRGDILELSGEEVTHSWEADLSKRLVQLSLDVHDLVSGCSLSDGVLTLSGDDIFMIPFYGPLPIQDGAQAACIEMDVTAFAGNGAVPIASFSPDIFDIYNPTIYYPDNINDPLHIGKNVWTFPDLAGSGFVAIGLMADTSISISSLKAIVKRKATPLPFSDSGESFKIRVESSAGDRLRFLQAFHNDRYYY